jgi:hypothetical protein
MTEKEKELLTKLEDTQAELLKLRNAATEYLAHSKPVDASFTDFTGTVAMVKLETLLKA